MINPMLFLEVPRSSTLKVLEAELRAVVEVSSRLTEAGFIARTIRGSKMRSVRALMDEVSAALQFPYYFGQNWDALDECLSDMDWLPPAEGIVLLITNAAEVLADERLEDLAILVGNFATATETYAAPIELGEWWDRPAVPFHVVLHVGPRTVEEMSHRWTSAGARLEHLCDG